MSQPKRSNGLARRLIPLYIAGFFQSFVLWYTIEKLFMQHIGFDNAAIGLMVAVYSAAMLAFEVPSGILADRWSRKGVLMLASISLALSSFVGGISNGIGTYLLSAILWGVFYACYSGMYDSILYDCIAESGLKSKSFDRLYGRIQAFDSLALIISGLIGAWVAATFGLRLAYFISVPLALIPLVALWFFKEPSLHKQHAVLTLKQQLKATFTSVVRNRSLAPVVVVLILRATLFYCLVEFAQLWLLALNTPTVYYGVATATLLASLGVGGLFVARWRLQKFRRVVGVLVVLLLACVGLIALRDLPGILFAQAVLASALVCLQIIFSRILHDNVAASVRAGAASAASTLGRLLIIPMALLFGYASQRVGVYMATYMLLALAIAMSVFVGIAILRSKQAGLAEL